MDNLEYLKAVRDNGLKEHLIKHPDGESSIGYRKTIALEIIAEELCVIRQYLTVPTREIVMDKPKIRLQKGGGKK